MQEWLSRQFFSQVHSRNLVYNTCWEDPRCDRTALQLKSDHEILVITSAGCNVLDYLLDNPARIHAIDMNPRQNALLQLKLAGLKNLDYDDFFRMFGEGRIDEVRAIYSQRLRHDLPAAAQAFWDRRIDFFTPGRFHQSFYHHGTTGLFARIANSYLQFRKAREAIEGLYEIDSAEERETYYNKYIRNLIWTDLIRRVLGYDATLSLLGVPRAQRQQIEQKYGSIVQFMEDALASVFVDVPPKENYFWWLYFFGFYTPECCPEYLKKENFEILRERAGCVSTYDGSIIDYLENHEVSLDRFVLLDHMDWLATYGKPILEAEWQAIVNRAAPGARILWRSASPEVDFVNPIQVEIEGQRRSLGDVLRYDTGLASELHHKDRVRTYGSFYIADIAA